MLNVVSKCSGVAAVIIIFSTRPAPANNIDLALLCNGLGPGDTALTRISRGSNSVASVRAKDRSAALAPPYARYRLVIRVTAISSAAIGLSFETPLSSAAENDNCSMSQRAVLFRTATRV